VVDLGYNYRLDEVRAALGRVQLQKVTKGNQRRAELADLYRKQLNKHVPQIHVPYPDNRGISSHYIFPILLPEGSDKLAFMAGMKESGIQTSWHYPPVHHFSIYEAEWLSRNDQLPITEETAVCEVTLPLYPTMREEQVGWVVEAIQDVI
jgi:dTDP-4-amino-4,6-dideoxygalactose transaminase